MTATLGGDGLEGMQRADSSQMTNASFSSIHIGVLTAKSDATKTGFVRIPALNQSAQLGPFKFMESFSFPVATPVKQTLNTTSAVVSGTSVLTGASLSSTTTNLSGVYSGALTLPDIGTRVLVVFLNDSLDEGVIVGKI
jgi:hypothetical protein